MADNILKDRAGSAGKVYYTVQDRSDRERLAAGGDPWPRGLPRAVLGPGFYCWSTLRQAEKYRRLLVGHGADDVEVVRYAINRSNLKALRTLDLRTMSNDELEAWLQEYSEYTYSPPPKPHGFDCVVRKTGNVGQEHHFSPDTFRRFFHELLD